MKKSVLVFAVVLSTLVLGSFAAVAADSSEEDAIIATIRDYIDGWYDGDVDRMKNALHPDLAKRSIRAMPDGSEIVNSLSASNMIAYTKAGFGKKNKKEGQKNEVVVLEILSQTASAKSISPEFIDFIHLAKIEGKWWIVNVLWEPNK